MLYIVSDHGGFALKQRLMAWLKQQKISFTDLGPERRVHGDDYPLYATKLAKKVALSSTHRGLAICRSGVGMAIVANKHPGIRAVQAITPAIAVRSRHDENTNIMTIAADYQTWPVIQATIKRWLAAPFAQKTRYQRRLREIKKIERGR